MARRAHSLRGALPREAGHDIVSRKPGRIRLQGQIGIDRETHADVVSQAGSNIRKVNAGGTRQLEIMNFFSSAGPRT